MKKTESRSSNFLAPVAGLSLLAALALLSACETVDPLPGNPGPTAPTGPQVRLDFEGTQVADLVSAGQIYAETADVYAPWGGPGDAAATDVDMAFEVEGTVVDQDSGSLKVTANALQNKYSAETAQWSLALKISEIPGIAAVQDLTGKTVSVRYLVPAGGDLMGVKIILRNANGEQSQSSATNIANADEWTTASYTFGTDSTDYTSDNFDIKTVSTISLLALKVPATGNLADEVVYFDQLTW